MVVDPVYKDISADKDQVASYNEALNNSKALETERDSLATKYSMFHPDDLSKLQKLLPDNVDNIRLILEIENVASPYGMVLKDVKYDTSNADANTTTATTTSQTTVTKQSNKTAITNNYGIWNLEFSTQGTYNNFVKFMKDLENNLRIVDISSIQFSSKTANTGLNPSLPEVYKYNIKIRTYWLKN